MSPILYFYFFLYFFFIKKIAQWQLKHIDVHVLKKKYKTKETKPNIKIRKELARFYFVQKKQARDKFFGKGGSLFLLRANLELRSEELETDRAKSERELERERERVRERTSCCSVDKATRHSSAEASSSNNKLPVAATRRHRWLTTEEVQ